MDKMATRGMHIAGLLALTLIVASCGDSNVRVSTAPGEAHPAPGTFTGSMSDGGSIEFQVGSIEAVRFDCDGDSIQQTFSPPQAINDDGTFKIDFQDAGRLFTIRGIFRDNNNMDGTIDDANNHCDTTYDAERSSGSLATRTPTPVITPTSGPLPTFTETLPTVTVVGPTNTSETVTVTPTGGAVTITPTVVVSPCPNKVTLEGQGLQADLDTGWTGIAFDQTVIDKGSLTVALSCPGTPGACGSCTVSGPIESTTVVNPHRCSNDLTKTCTAASDCGGAECDFFFGAPLPLSSGNVPVCVVNKVNGSISGTADPDAGSGSSSVNLTSMVFSGIDTAQPCPKCTGASFNTAGTCDYGSASGSAPPGAQGRACTVHGLSKDFGNTSYDCPPIPTGNIGNLSIALNPTTGTSTLSPSSSTKCAALPFGGKNCYCSGQSKANDCGDGLCAADANGDGVCSEDFGPSTGTCSVETFRGCQTNTDCACPTCKPSQVCQFSLRPCIGLVDSTFNAIGPITRTGTPSKTNPTVVSTFCVPATTATAVNAAAGLPGPGALKLPSKSCFLDSCSF